MNTHSPESQDEAQPLQAHAAFDAAAARTHEFLDRRSLSLHCLIAQRLREAPERLHLVCETLAHWRVVVDVRSQPYVAEWQRLADAGLQACLAVACEDSERARALRQCSPFARVLSHRERFAFFKEWAQKP